jgi:hypothetical protein
MPGKRRSRARETTRRAADAATPAVVRILEEQITDILRDSGLTPGEYAAVAETLARGVQGVGSFLLAGLEAAAQADAQHTKIDSYGRRVSCRR